jgi:hypothetical protein
MGYLPTAQGKTERSCDRPAAQGAAESTKNGVFSAKRTQRVAGKARSQRLKCQNPKRSRTQGTVTNIGLHKVSGDYPAGRARLRPPAYLNRNLRAGIHGLSPEGIRDQVGAIGTDH